MSILIPPSTAKESRGKTRLSASSVISGHMFIIDLESEDERWAVANNPALYIGLAHA